jgi:thymidylate synthase (FAD)
MNIVPITATLEDITAAAPQKIERWARVCYKSEPKEDGDEATKRFLHGLLRRGHMGCFEHAKATVLCQCDRGVTHELVRHRMASYLHESTRYVDYGGEIAVVAPPLDDDDAAFVWGDAMYDAEESYARMRRHEQQPQIARGVLPINVATHIVVTMNFAAWHHFLDLRLYGLTGKPHPMMQELAQKILVELYEACPEVFGRDAFMAKWEGKAKRLNKEMSNGD